MKITIAFLGTIVRLLIYALPRATGKIYDLPVLRPIPYKARLIAASSQDMPSGINYQLNDSSFDINNSMLAQ